MATRTARKAMNAREACANFRVIFTIQKSPGKGAGGRLLTVREPPKK